VEFQGIVFSSISVSLGTLAYCWSSYHVNGYRLFTEELELMLVGVAGPPSQAVVSSTSRIGKDPQHTVDRRVSVLQRGCRSSHQGATRPTLRVLSSSTTRPSHQILPVRRTSGHHSNSAAERSFLSS